MLRLAALSHRSVLLHTRSNLPRRQNLGRIFLVHSRPVTTEPQPTRNNINAAAELVRLRVKNAASARIAHEQATKLYKEGADDKALAVDSAAAASRRARQEVKIALDNLAQEMKTAAIAKEQAAAHAQAETIQAAAEKAVAGKLPLAGRVKSCVVLCSLTNAHRFYICTAKEYSQVHLQSSYTPS